MSNKIPRVGEKVRVDSDIGIITHVYLPDGHHSGRFIVYFDLGYRKYSYEFWFSDYGESVKPLLK